MWDRIVAWTLCILFGYWCIRVFVLDVLDSRARRAGKPAPIDRLTLSDGRVLHLEQFQQSRTYLGLWEGTPWKEINDEFVARWLNRARRYAVLGREPTLIEPVRRNYRHTPGDLDHYLVDEPDTPRELLPDVVCMASYNSDSIPADRPTMMSNGVIVWFQDDFGLPSEQFVRERLVPLKWRLIGRNFEP